MNAKYDEGRNQLALSNINLDTDTLTLYALDNTYVFDATDVFADLPTELDSEALTTTTVSSDGWLSSDPVVFSGLAIGEDTASLVLRDTTTGDLLAFYDTFAGDLTINVVGDGTDVTINPPTDGWYRV